MNHTCLCFLSRSWYSFTDPRGTEGWVGLSFCTCHHGRTFLSSSFPKTDSPQSFHYSICAAISATAELFFLCVLGPIIMNILFRTKCNKQCKHKWKNTNQCSDKIKKEKDQKEKRKEKHQEKHLWSGNSKRIDKCTSILIRITRTV